MIKQIKVLNTLFYLLVILVAILAGSTSFFYAKSKSLQNRQVVTASKTAEVSSASTQSPTSAATSQVAKPSSQTERPSHPRDSYTVQPKDTLFGIATSQGVTLAELSEANGITDANKILSGQVLIVPKNGQVSYTIDNTQATDLQKKADSGQLKFRLNPEETARSDSPPAYGLKVEDTFTLEGSANNGQATVAVTSSDGKKYLIRLVQPVTKGDKGIWAIEAIVPGQ